jgi:phytoene/squalene synthetase
MLQQRPTDGNDDIDVLAMRLLLNDYVAAVAHLRAVARVAASLVDGVTAPVKQGHRLLRLDDKRRQKQAGSVAPPASDQHT